MASLHTITSQTFLPLTKPTKTQIPKSSFHLKPIQAHPQKPLDSLSQTRTVPSQPRSVAGRTVWVRGLGSDELEIEDLERESDEEVGSQVVVTGFGNEGRLSFEGGGEFPVVSTSTVTMDSEEEFEKLVDRVINGTIVLAAGSFAITKLLTIDQDYWHGWTVFEILRYAPLHNWTAYEEALKTNPVLAKMVISGVVYSVGDWIAQCYEGKPIFEFDRARMFRSGIVGFTLHGSLSHYYYHVCEALFPFHDWWVVPVKVAFDQTIWSAIWNSIYFTAVGLLRFESPATIFSELIATFFPMLTAGWKLWPFAHLITYGLIPVEQRLLWVDCVELIWVTILSTYSNEKSEARALDAATPMETNSNSPLIGPPEE